VTSRASPSGPSQEGRPTIGQFQLHAIAEAQRAPDRPGR
jgi:hypothetical protein